MRNDSGKAKTRRDRPTIFDAAEDLAGTPRGGPLLIWGVGVGLAVIPVGYGLACLASGRATLIGARGGTLTLTGAAATALSLTWIAVGAFLHFQWFWSLRAPGSAVGELGKAAAVLLFAGGLAFVAYHVVFRS
jgi:hypothetical protein